MAPYELPYWGPSARRLDQSNFKDLWAPDLFSHHDISHDLWLSRGEEVERKKSVTILWRVSRVLAVLEGDVGEV